MDNSLKKKLIFGKYKILKLIEKGSFGEVYLGKNIINEKLYAIKIENQCNELLLLEREAFILYNIRGQGIPSLISYGYCGKFNILIETLLGKSLEQIWKENNKKLNTKDICMIAIQTIDRIEHIHSKDYIHRDIKPANFLVGNPDNSQIYIFHWLSLLILAILENIEVREQENILNLLKLIEFLELQYIYH